MINKAQLQKQSTLLAQLERSIEQLSLDELLWLLERLTLRLRALVLSPSPKVTPDELMDNPTALAALYQEAAPEDKELAEIGLEHYANMLA